jgi:anti-sigma regulatory factor (Ser/Thr protein kinase)
VTCREIRDSAIGLGHNRVVDAARDHPHEQVRVRMVAQPASIPAARRMVDDALTVWEREDLAGDVALCVTELATNATLHGGDYFEIEVALVGDRVRVAVVDSGGTPAEQIARHVDLPDTGRREAEPEPLLDDTSMTGRGLFIVSALATGWGIEDRSDGTRIWAEFDASLTHEQRGLSLAPPVVAASTPLPAPDLSDPDVWLTVHLVGVPPDLVLAHDDNLADIVRELQLMDAQIDRRGRRERLDPAKRRVMAEISDVVRANAPTWDAARLVARHAIRSGRPTVDIAVVAPRGVAAEVRRLRAAVDAAEEMSRSGELITLPAGPAVQRLRDWMEEQFIGQADEGLAPVAYDAWCASRADDQPS